VTVDWMQREAARVRRRVLVERILRKYGYPPNLQAQAEKHIVSRPVLRHMKVLTALGIWDRNDRIATFD
jgi:hypothetical protein